MSVEYCPFTYIEQQAYMFAAVYKYVLGMCPKYAFPNRHLWIATMHIIIGNIILEI